MKKKPLKLDWRKLVGFDNIESFMGHLGDYYATKVTEPLDKFATLDYKLIEETFEAIEKQDLMDSRGKWVCWLYDDDFLVGSEAEELLHQEKVLILDTETNGKTKKLGVKTGLLTVQALGTEGIYLWSHPELKRGRKELKKIIETVSIGEGHLVIAHNSAFDYVRITESYSIPRQNLWFDTISMAKAVDEANSRMRYQRYLRESMKEDFNKVAYGLPGASLKELLKFYLGMDISKDEREFFVKGFLEVIQNFEDALTYSLRDVLYTFKLFQHLWPLYKQFVPHPISHFAHGCMASQVIGVNKDYESWLQNTKVPVEEIREHRQKLWLQLIEEVKDDKDYDPWTRLLPDDWYEETLSSLEEKGEPNTLVRGLLLRLCYANKPILPFRNKKTRHIVWLTYDGEKLPENERLNDFISYGKLDRKDTLEIMESTGVIYSARPGITREILNLNVQLAYYNTYIKRARNCPRKDRVSPLECLPHGTITKRATGGILMTAKGHPQGLPLHELRAMFGAHREDYRIVYADFDSQESRIGALLADNFSGKGELGLNKNSEIVFTGTKAEKTDYHSIVAQMITDKTGTHCSRDVGKQANLGMQYGMGVSGLAKELTPYLNGDAKLAKEIAKLAVDIKKGGRNYLGFWEGGLDSNTWNFYEERLKVDFRTEPFLNLAFPRSYQPSTQRAKGDSQDQLGLCNYFCQGGGVAMLHLTIGIMEWLFQKEKMVGCGYSCSIHDEVVFLAPEPLAYKTAWLLQATHFMVWHWCQWQLGLPEEITERAYFEDVAISLWYRKDPDKYDYKTLTHEGFPLEKGYTMEQLCTLI